MGLRSKLKAYIRDDRPAKVKSCIQSHDTDPCEIKFKRGKNLLHYCAQYGSSDMLRCLLRLECDPACQDKDGQTPLHINLQRCLAEDLESGKLVYDTMVCLLMSVCPMSLDVEDRYGVTGQDLLKKWKKKVECIDKVQSGSNTVEDESVWQKKLAQETQCEWEEQLPRYNLEDDYFDEEQNEDYASWSDRIYQEYKKKKQNEGSYHHRSNPRKRAGFSDSAKQENKRQRENLKPDPDEELRKAREEMRKNFKLLVTEPTRIEQLKSRKDRYEKQFHSFFSNSPKTGTVTFGAVPWPCNNMEKLTETLFCDLPEKESTEYRKYLRREQVRWHPDKFSQKFKDFLHPDHILKIMARVKTISQTLNSIAS